MNNNSPFHNSMAEQMWDMKYRLKEQDGTPIDDSVEDTWRRVAWSLSEPEVDRKYWSDKFMSVLRNFSFIPAGRINAGAGTDRNVTLFNCFVMGTVPDSLAGICDMLKEAAVTMQAGGGIGYDFSTIRPHGAEVKGVAAEASGPLTFMDVWDSMCKTIMSAGVRRGAMMATMRCDHPDVEKFIDAKRDANRLRMFNLSVLVTDPFMEAVKSNGDWPLVFGGKVYKVIKARALWDKIMGATYHYAEPGVIFIDRINQDNNLNYCETIAATNPCVSGDTEILTRGGYIPISNLVGVGVDIWNGEEWAKVDPYETGYNDLVRVNLSDGSHLDCTWDHKWVLRDEGFTETNKLKVGDALQKFDMPVVYGGVDYDVDAYSQGFYAGDGNKGMTRSWIYEPKYPCMDRLIGKVYVDGAQVHRKIWNHGPMLDSAFVPISGSIGYRLNWLAGILDSDGTVTRDKNGSGFQIASVDHDFLDRIRLMLTTMGVRAKVVHANNAGYRDMPDGRGGIKEYYCKETKRILIGNTDAYHLMQLGLNLSRLDHNGNEPQRDARRFVRVTSIEPLDRHEMTYCFTEPNTSRGTFNGIVTGQCGEQPLPPYGACLLGSVNMAAMLRDDFTVDEDKLRSTVRVAVRMMDNVVDVSRFPLPQQEKEAKNKRRIGLGVTGVANAMALGGVVYGSDEGAEWVDRYLHVIAREAYLASIDLAKEKGAFPLFDVDGFLESGNMQKMDTDIQESVREHGIRNALLTSIAPTGTISLYAGNVSSGIEPTFAFEYDRKVMQKDGSKVTETVRDYAADKWRRVHPDKPFPDSFVSAQTLSPSAHVKMQAAAQKWIDSSISKTINCPEDISFDEFKDVYMMAWDMGCKGCTTYRPNDVTGSVLSVKEEPEGGSCELKYDENTGQIIRSCE